MANCLILLSKIATENDAVLHRRDQSNATTAAGDGRLFECKTCEKKFPSFQALGGHRASHNKPKLQQAHNNHPLDSPPGAKPNNKTHECAICGLEFAMGQALGGHMRRHRAALSLLPAVAMMKKSSSSPAAAAAKSTGHGGKRVMCLDLDLNLTPVENYDLKLQLGSALQIA
ncbi:unnamed protein product [Linum tenue]|nr:unnamed protein product [Linum tenue]